MLRGIAKRFPFPSSGELPVGHDIEEPSRNVQMKNSAEEGSSCVENCAAELHSVWHRPVAKVTKQIGKDLPRFANKIKFCPETSDFEVLFEDFKKYQENTFSPFLNLEQMPELFLTFLKQEKESMTRTERKNWELKGILLLSAHFLECAALRQVALDFIDENFESAFLSSGDMAFVCELFVEKCFIPEERKEENLAFPVSSDALNIMRSFTQGHFAPVATLFQQELGMENITRNVSHKIYVSAPTLPLDPDNPSHIRITHIKLESAHWGDMWWCVAISTGKDKELSEILFQILDIDFAEDIREETERKIVNALHPFFSPSLLSKDVPWANELRKGPLNYEFQGMTNEKLEEKMFSLENSCASPCSLLLMGNHLSSLPLSISMFSHSLLLLSLIKNRFTHFPVEVLALENLRDLHLGMNEIPSVPKEIENLKFLETLHLSNNRLATLPTSVCSLPYLTSITLAANQIRKLPAELSSLPLQHFSIHNNPISIATGFQSPLQTKEDIIEFFGALPKNEESRSVHFG